VFVVDRVELEPVNEVDQIRHLHGDQSAIAREHRQRADEPVKVGNMGEDIVRDHQVGRAALSHQLTCKLLGEKRRDRFDAVRPCDFRDVQCRLDA